MGAMIPVPEPVVQPIVEEQRLREIGMRYLVARPGTSAVERVLVAVHGVSREWREMADHLLGPCLEARTALIVPRFSRSGYRGFQRLEVGRKGVAADHALLTVLDDAAQRFEIAPTAEVLLFGYSGGAQFAHRFSLAHPDRVRRQALAAAGFYTMPDTASRYPYGLAPGGRFGSLDMSGLLLPTKVLVGELDTDRDPQLRTGRSLDRQQGRNRVERARRFVLATRILAGSCRRPPDCSFEILRNCGHSFVECAEKGDLARKVVDFLVR